MTVPDARRRGIGAAIALAALREARSLGYQAAVLGTSEMARGIYTRLGFRQYCTIATYAWAPPT